MSTYWGFHCRTDGAASPHWLNHGDDQLRMLVRLLPHIRAITAAEDCWIVSVDVLGGYDDPMPLTWLAEHDGHDIELQDEYGRTAPLAPTTE